MINFKTATSLLILTTFLAGTSTFAMKNEEDLKVVIRLKAQQSPQPQEEPKTQAPVSSEPEKVEELRIQNEPEAEVNKPSLQTELAEPEAEIPQATTQTAAASAAQPTIDIIGGRSNERVNRNIERETQRGVESFNNFLNGKGWKSNTRLAKDAKRKNTEKNS